jgi:uncharacterized protein (TIGR00369 family)
MNEAHFRKLEALYRSAPTNAYYAPEIRIGEATAEIRITIRPEFHHAAEAVHGSVYFKMLDDAAFFAANSLVEDVMMLTSNFTLHFLRPVSSGLLIAKGTVVNSGARQFLAQSQLFDDGNRLIAHGVGTFMRSRISLERWA